MTKNSILPAMKDGHNSMVTGTSLSNVTERILIIHDTFLYRGGAERLILLMAKTLGADIASGFFSPGSYDFREQGFSGKTISLMPDFFLHEFRWLPKTLAFIFRNGLRHIGLRFAFAYRTKEFATKYDTIILSGDCLSAMHQFSEKKVIYYCHTIPRYLFDQRDAYEKKVPLWIRPIYRILTSLFRVSYLRNLGEVTTIITNSKNTQKRIKKFTGRNADIVYPPTDTTFFRPVTAIAQESENKNTNTSPVPHEYFLSFARLSSIKRVDYIIDAFLQMPEKVLVFTYADNDPEKDAIFARIGGAPNIFPIRSPDDQSLLQLIQGAVATIYIPIDEDFGMSPVESMACGVPVIGVAEGGLLETIIDGKTGKLIRDGASPSHIITSLKDIIQNTSTQEWKSMKEKCIIQSKNFSLEKFQKIMTYHVTSLKQYQPSNTVIVHEAFLFRGGGERLVSLMGKSLDADIVSGFFAPGTFEPRNIGFRGKLISLGFPVRPKGFRHLILKWRFGFCAKIVSTYSTVILSGDCFPVLRYISPQARTIYYCHAPPRYLFEWRDQYLQGFPRLFRPLVNTLFDYFARKYNADIKKVDIILTSAKNVATRIKKYSHVDAQVLYPPIDTKHFSPANESDWHKQASEYPILSELGFKKYYFSFARLSPQKRIDVIIDAFLHMPDQILIFTYGINDEMTSELLDKIQSVKNIIAIPAPDEGLLVTLVQGALSTIYISYQEDFGMAPVESMACGVPVIGVAEGGMLETILDGSTGKLIGYGLEGDPLSIKNKKILSAELQGVIKSTSPEMFISMYGGCITQSQNFSLEKFEESLKGYLSSK